MNDKSSAPSLKRSLSLPLITLYGLGTILGAGVYVLIGKVVAYAGMYAPISFLLAALIATFTGLSYAELAGRFPKSAGEAEFMEQGFSQKWLSQLVGLSVILTGLVSAAAIFNGFIGYAHIFVDLSPVTIKLILAFTLGSLAILGIVESVGAATIITLLELGGLVFVLLVLGENFAEIPQRYHEIIPPGDGLAWSGIIAGSFLAFYAFIGFEDMVNVAEEVIEPKKNLPRSIILALVISSLLYLLVAIVAVLAVAPNVLAESNAPLADLVTLNSNFSPRFISFISMLAVINGALVQIIMASRVLYGLAISGKAPSWFAKVNASTRTPILSTVAITLIVLSLALWFPIEGLANTTSFITLIIFALVNISLLMVKRKKPVFQGFRNHVIIPVIGAFLCLAMVLARFV